MTNPVSGIGVLELFTVYGQPYCIILMFELQTSNTIEACNNTEKEAET